MENTVTGRMLKYETQDQTTWGDKRVLVDDADDLTLSTSWHKTGFSIQNFLNIGAFVAFKERTRKLLFECWRSAGLVIPDDFLLDQYHTVAKDSKKHLAAVDQTRLLQVEKFPVPIDIVENRVSEICKTPLIARNPFDNLSIFHFRVIRPGQWDNNPLHRDVWLEDYANCINLYIPIAGSNELSSLIIVPGSHLWPESKIERTVGGAEIKGVKYNVPAVTGIDGPYNIERPSPMENELLVFSPYLIHGGAVNLNTDETRISIELRLWKK